MGDNSVRVLQSPSVCQSSPCSFSPLVMDHCDSLGQSLSRGTVSQPPEMETEALGQLCPGHSFPGLVKNKMEPWRTLMGFSMQRDTIQSKFSVSDDSWSHLSCFYALGVLGTSCLGWSEWSLREKGTLFFLSFLNIRVERSWYQKLQDEAKAKGSSTRLLNVYVCLDLILNRPERSLKPARQSFSSTKKRSW